MMATNTKQRSDPNAHATNAMILRIPRIARAPWLYGDLSDPAWGEVAVFEGFLDCTAYLRHRYDVSFGNPGQFSRPPPPAPARPSTRVHLCHDGKVLFVGFECLDTDIGSLLRRDRPYGYQVEREDCVFLWIDPIMQHLGPFLNRYILNAAGQKGETLRGRAQGDYDSIMVWEGAAAVAADRWTGEMMLPLERLGITAESAGVFGLNLGRGYRGDMQTHLLAPPEEDFMCGWGIGLLEDLAGVTEADKQSRLDANVTAIRRRQVGIALLGEPGSPRHPNPHRDENTMIGMLAWGPDHQPTLSLGRSDSYDRRWYGNEAPAVTRAEVVAAAMSGDPARLNALRNRACDRQYSAYSHFPGPAPVGQLILMLPGGQDAGWTTDVAPGADGAVDMLCRCARGEIRLHVYVHKKRNLVVVEGVQSGFNGETLSVRVYRHDSAPAMAKLPGYDYDADPAKGWDTGPLPPPEAGCRGEFGYVRQGFYAESTFPDGFATAIVATACQVRDLSIKVSEEETGLGTPAWSPMEGWADPATGQTWAATNYTRMNALPGRAATLSCRLDREHFRVMAAVVSTNDGPDLLAAGENLLRAIREVPRDRLEAESRAASIRERVGGYCYQQDLALSSIFSAKFCARDDAAWHGDFHFNEWGGASAAHQFYDYFLEGRTAELENYFQMVEENLPAARALARQAFGCAGAAWGVTSFPRRFERLPMAHLDWDYSLECTGLVLQPFWLTWQYTTDKTFLRDRAYPAIREGAQFYSDYATLEDDGLYHLWPCVSSEHVSLQPGLKYNRDANAALAMTRFMLRAAIEGAETLGLDAELLPKWKDVLAHLAPYPTEDTPEGPRFVDVAGARLMSEYNIFQPLFAVFYGNDIGLASPPEILGMARRTLRGLRRLSTGHWHHVIRAMMRLGIHPGMPVPGDYGPQLHPDRRQTSYDLANKPGECLLQSHQGPIFLFPAVPDGYTGRFENLHARGAFVVSAAMADGRVTCASIRSFAGGVCRLANPWPGRQVVVRVEDNKEAVPHELDTRSGEYLVFRTEQGKAYSIDEKRP
jgi:hypothetical protein